MCPFAVEQNEPQLTKDSVWQATRRPEPYRHPMKKTIDEVRGGAPLAWLACTALWQWLRQCCGSELRQCLLGIFLCSRRFSPCTHTAVCTSRRCTAHVPQAKLQAMESSVQYAVSRQLSNAELMQLLDASACRVGACFL
jgi:hypothetical protein